MTDDELFAHLEELVEALPKMQKKGDALAGARAAVEVAKRAQYLEGQQNELNGILSAMEECSRARNAAIVAGDVEAEEAQRAKILLLGNERGIRKGAADAAQRELDHALSAGGFSNVEAAHAAQLPQAELAALIAEVEAFQADYAETLVACQALEGVEEA